MKRKGIATGRGIELVKRDKRIAVSQEGVEIHRKDEPVKREVIEMGHVYLVVDCSSSMMGQKVRQAKRGAVDFVREARRKRYLIGLIQFSSSAHHLCHPQSETSTLKEHLERIGAGGSTNMAEGIWLAIESLGDKKGPRTMVIITDGMPDDKEAALRAAKEAKDSGIDIITIGTDDADRKFLEKIATRANLATFVAREKLAQAITSTAQMLPKPK